MALPRTQHDLNALLGLWADATGQRHYPEVAMNTITMEFQGYTVTLDVAPADGVSESDRFQQAIAYFASQGFGPVGGEQPGLRDRLGAPPAAPQQQQYQQPGQQQAAVCPVHGGQAIGPGYNNRGFECKVSSNTRPQWRFRQGKDKQTGQLLDYTFIGREGGPVYCCAWKSQ